MDQPPRTILAVPAVAVGLIVAGDGRLLLQHRDDKPGILSPGRWGFFGGHVEPGELESDAFLREIEEELGWRPRHFEPYLVREIKREDWLAMSHVFAAHLDVAFDDLVQTEGQGMALFPIDALPDALISGLDELIATFAGSDAYKRVKHRYDVISTTGILVDADGRFLLQHRDDKPGIDNPGRWGSFGGALDDYETPGDGFLREIEEELCWRPKSFELYGSAPYRPDGRPGVRQLIYLFAAPVDVHLSALRLTEGQDMAFFTLDDLPETTVPAYRALLHRFAADALCNEMMQRARSSESEH